MASRSAEKKICGEKAEETRTIIVYYVCMHSSTMARDQILIFFSLVQDHTHARGRSPIVPVLVHHLELQILFLYFGTPSDARILEQLE